MGFDRCSLQSPYFLIPYKNSGNLIYKILIRLFAFEEEICAIIIEDGGIPLYNGGAVLGQSCEAIIIMPHQDIHGAEDMLVIKVRLFKIKKKNDSMWHIWKRDQESSHR